MDSMFLDERFIVNKIYKNIQSRNRILSGMLT